MRDTIIRVICSSCDNEFLFSGSVEQVPDSLCLDCFVEKYGDEESEGELAEAIALAGSD